MSPPDLNLPKGPKRVRLGKYFIPVPGSRIARIVLGSVLILGGVFSVLPVLGLWMIPLGLVVLSVDSAIVRRGRRRAELRWAKFRAERTKR